MSWNRRLRFLSHNLRKFSTQHEVKTSAIIEDKLQMPIPEYDTDYFCDPSNRDEIHENIRRRNSLGDIDKVLSLSQKPECRSEFLRELAKLPNRTHPEVFDYGTEHKVLKTHGTPWSKAYIPWNFADICHKLKLLRMQTLGPVTGSRGYILQGDLARLEDALVHYSVQCLMKHGFTFHSVPDIIPSRLIERCGLIEDGDRTLVYSLEPHYGDQYSLSGTAEMSLAGKLMNSELSLEQLPLKIAAVSRCYRAETSNLVEERGIYRVHQFTKVEMFSCSTQEDSESMFKEIRSIQEELFSGLNLHFRTIDMPPSDLGSPAYRKIDIEAWLPARKYFGEISSCSNCTDYQSRRLNIKYRSKNGELLHVHTLNGTACAVPRMLIAICENFQTKHEEIEVPKKLVPFMDGQTVIKKQMIASSRTYKYKPKITN